MPMKRRPAKKRCRECERLRRDLDHEIANCKKWMKAFENTWAERDAAIKERSQAIKENYEYSTQLEQWADNYMAVKEERDKYKHLHELDHSLANQWSIEHEKYAALESRYNSLRNEAELILECFRKADKYMFAQTPITADGTHWWLVRLRRDVYSYVTDRIIEVKQMLAQPESQQPGEDEGKV